MGLVPPLKGTVGAQAHSTIIAVFLGHLNGWLRPCKVILQPFWKKKLFELFSQDWHPNGITHAARYPKQAYILEVGTEYFLWVIAIDREDGTRITFFDREASTEELERYFI